MEVKMPFSLESKVVGLVGWGESEASPLVSHRQLDVSDVAFGLQECS